MSASATSSTARKIIGSLGVVGAAAAVAGMGTFGNFTDSSTPVATTITSGNLSINAAQPTGAVALNASGLVPGDTATRLLNVVNDGTTDFGSVTLTSTATGTPSVLTSDAINGLKIAVNSCSVAWTQATPTAPFVCSTGARPVLTSNPVVTSQQLTNPFTLAAGKTDHLAVTFSLPTSADNAFQNQSAGLSLQFTATQRAAGAR